MFSKGRCEISPVAEELVQAVVQQHQLRRVVPASADQNCRQRERHGQTSSRGDALDSLEDVEGERHRFQDAGRHG